MTLAAVVIGRNEGARLRRALESVIGRCAPVVYVDSASTDGSPDTARSLGADVLALDMSIPFTFGRARNRGAARVLELAPDTAFVQFLDADSEIAAAWLATATSLLSESATVAAVHGQVRERYGHGGLYGRLFALEFDPRAEAADVFGGMTMLRVSAAQQVGWYFEYLDTFEDHDLSARLRGAGWSIVRLDTDMAIHESGMSRGVQWWRREQRAGAGRAQLLRRHGWAGGSMWWRPVVSICLFGAVLPVLAVILFALAGPWALVAFIPYLALLYRIFHRMRRRGLASADAALFAAARVAGKFPQCHGVINQLRRRSGRA